MSSQDELDAEEGLEMLLGLASVDFSSAQWDAPDGADGSAAFSPPTPTAPDALDAPKPSSGIIPLSSNTAKPKIHHLQTGSSSSSTSPDIIFRSCFERAFSLSSNGVLSKPPVSIIDMSDNNRGYALVASRDISRGEVIYTERAAEASQMPRQCLICANERNQIGQLYGVKGCQHCFQSLEPASSILSFGDDTAKLPMEECWPVPEYGNDESYTGQSGRRRVQCQACNSLFCSRICNENHQKSLGNCCQWNEAIQAIVHAHCRESNESNTSVEPSIILGARMFCSDIKRYRGDYIEASPFIGICGENSDINPLEIGELRREENQDEARYSLERIYDALCNALELTGKERNAFSLVSYEKYVAMAARNGFNVTTRSPFREYYAAMTRATGGRNSERHKTTVRQLALALGAENSELRRDMDREIEEKVRF